MGNTVDYKNIPGIYENTILNDRGRATTVITVESHVSACFGSIGVILTRSYTKLFSPCALVAYGIVRKIEIAGPITQLFTRHGGFYETLIRYKWKENPSYICDPDVAEKILRLIMDCSVYLKQTNEVEFKLDIKLTMLNLSKIISSENRSIFLNYSINIVNRRNKKINFMTS